MPYFVYRIGSDEKMEQIDSHEKYRDAKVLVNELRAELAAGSEEAVRMIFAKNSQEAERLLARPPERDGRIIGDD